MTSADRNDLMPPQEKLEWVTPKISLMGAGDTDSKRINFGNECTPGGLVCGAFVPKVALGYGPS